MQILIISLDGIIGKEISLNAKVKKIIEKNSLDLIINLQ